MNEQAPRFEREAEHKKDEAEEKQKYEEDTKDKDPTALQWRPFLQRHSLFGRLCFRILQRPFQAQHICLDRIAESRLGRDIFNRSYRKDHLSRCRRRFDDSCPERAP